MVIKKEDEKDLDIINYSDIPYNDFNCWLTESLLYNADYVFNTDLEYFNKEDLEYKQIVDIRDIDIKFRFENAFVDDNFDYAVYCKHKNSDDWEYLDNISKELYDRRLETEKK